MAAKMYIAVAHGNMPVLLSYRFYHFAVGFFEELQQHKLE